ncbi:hypothetical protein ACS8E2_12645 [Psychrobacter glaciei]|uniref:hypothetical protein n=1 Tax=Psychrobacter glaciei TaxID=619771 RepID=UPI003F46A18A
MNNGLSVSDNGFKVAPRKPHSVSEVLPLTQAEKEKTIAKVIKGRFSQYGLCHVSIFPDRSRKNALAQLRKIQQQGLMDIEQITKGKLVIGYRLISKQ